MSSDVQEHRNRLADRLRLDTAEVIIDLGCGAGDDLTLLAGRAPTATRLIGFDSAASTLARARERTQDPRLEFLEHLLGDPLPLPSRSVDVVYSDNVLECVADKAGLLREIHRVLRTDGQVLCAHWDWDSQLIDASDKALVRRIVHAFADWQQPWMENADGWMGRRLWGTFQDTGLFVGQVVADTLVNTSCQSPGYGHARICDFAALVKQGRISREDYEQLLHEVHSLDERGCFFYSITSYAYVGCPRA
jgi:SAM-dependent methyltransferase